MAAGQLSSNWPRVSAVCIADLLLALEELGIGDAADTQQTGEDHAESHALGHLDLPSFSMAGARRRRPIRVGPCRRARLGRGILRCRPAKCARECAAAQRRSRAPLSRAPGLDMTTADTGDPDEDETSAWRLQTRARSESARSCSSGCVNQNTWVPTVDTYGDPNAWRLSQDEAQCRQLAMQASGSTVKKTAEGVGIGGLLGAAAGAAIGAAAGDPGMGAAIGRPRPVASAAAPTRASRRTRPSRPISRIACAGAATR